ncbi:MAG: response regulator [Anaerolineae bacterium]|nr:response regulator [Anaerolineae bacterium]
MTSAPTGEVVPRHLVFVLEDREIVIQRGANLVEVFRTGEWRVFGDYERDHNITDEELRLLEREELIQGFDETTIWLPVRQKSNRAKYYFLDTRLSPPYLELVRNLLHSTNQNYTARVRMGRVTVVAAGGEPFGGLTDAEAAHTLLSPAFKAENIALTIDSVKLESLLDETDEPDDDYENLIRETPSHALSVSDQVVLVVESDPELADHYTLALQNLGVEVRVAHTGEAALQIAMDEEPDLVLMNLMLPDMHGYEVIAKLRKDPLTDQTAIIVMSDVSSQQDVVFALNVAQVDDFLVKPIGPKILRRRILGILMQQQW